jgi:hypothetical protein
VLHGFLLTRILHHMPDDERKLVKFKGKGENLHTLLEIHAIHNELH